MALSELPPWLNVSPHDFVQAASAGATLGHAIADSTLRAWEEQARMRMQAQEAAANRESHAQQVAVENAMARLAADRLEAYRQSEIANRQKELGLQQQGLGLQQQGLTMRGERESDLEDAREQRLKDAEQAHKDKLAQLDFANQMSQRAADLRDKALDLKEKAIEKERPVMTKLAADQFGSELSGPIDAPAIVKRLKQRDDALEAAKNAPNPLVRAYNYLTGQTSTPTPSPTGSIPMNPVYPNPNNVAAPAPLTTVPASSKVQKAKEIYQKHPDWSKQQVIDAVNSGLE